MEVRVLNQSVNRYKPEHEPLPQMGSLLQASQKYRKAKCLSRRAMTRGKISDDRPALLMDESASASLSSRPFRVRAALCLELCSEYIVLKGGEGRGRGHTRARAASSSSRSYLWQQQQQQQQQLQQVEEVS